MAAEFTERRIQSNGNTTNVNIAQARNQPYVDIQKNGKTERIYGSQEQLDAYKEKQLAQKSTDTGSKNLSVSRGRVENTTNVELPGAVNEIIDGVPEKTELPAGTTQTKGSTGLINIVQNPMEQFASYSPLWTMAVLTPTQFNDPSSYRSDDLSFAGYKDSFEDKTFESSIIFSSGGRGDEFRTQTFYGSPEYYVDNFVMRSVISASPATGNSNALKFEFEIYEPYSMGLLLQSMQNAAIKAGYANYLDNCPYLLRLDFKGFSETGEEYTSIKPKYFVMKLSGVKFEVNEGGSIYKVEAIPYNHQAFSDTMNITFKDLALKAGSKGTVEELLVTGPESLVAALNANEKKLVDEKRITVPDEYDIQFPEKSSDFQSRSKLKFDKTATINPQSGNPRTVIKGTDIEAVTDFTSNPIGKSTFGYDAGQGGNFVFKKEGDVVDEKTGKIIRDKMTIDPKNRTFMFSQGQSLTEIINQVVLSSQYAKDAINPPVDPDGFIRWFRLDIQVEFGDFDYLVGDYARKIIFRVVPFLVHHSIFSNPNSAPIGYDQLEKKIAKKYDYIYTGQNADIINFDIQINNLFYTGVNSSSEGNTASEQNPDTKGAAPDQPLETETPEGSAPETQAAQTGRSRPMADPTNLRPKFSGGSGSKDTEQMIAESFHNAFINGSSADLISLDLEIMGDPYWLVDSGISNYFAEVDEPTDLLNADGTANYEGSDVYIYVTFRTPADVDIATGMYQFSKNQNESPFGGIYRVTMCENTFSDGKFTQKLTCVRMPGQPSDYDGNTAKTDPQNATAIKTGKPKPEKTGVNDNSTSIAKRVLDIDQAGRVRGGL